MGFLRGIKQALDGASTPSPPPVQKYTKRPQLYLRAWERDEVGEDGTPMTGSGYRLFSDSKGTMVWNEDTQVQNAGLRMVNKVAGVSYRAEALNSPAFAPGQWVQLIADPANEHDRHAVGVWSADSTTQVGWLPRELAAEISPRLQAQQLIVGFVCWQHHLANGDRCGINLLIGPPEPVTYVHSTI